MRALVTGANGLIGANVVRSLIAGGYQARALVRETSDLACLEGLDCEIHYGDVLVEATVREAARGCDYIFHTAVPFAYSGQVDDDVLRTATEGSSNVLHAAKATGVPRVVVTSSSVVFGYRNTADVVPEDTEVTEPAGESGYAVAKVRQDATTIELGHKLGVEVVLPCPTMSVGPFGTRLSASNGVIVQYLADPLRMTYPGGINIAAVQDVAAGHVLLAEFGRPFERYLLGGENLSWTQVHETIADLAGVPAPQMTINHTTAYLAATAEETRARIERRAALTTREQAKMVGRYYWYEHARAADLGFTSRPARDAIAGAVASLAAGPHVSREVRATMHLHADTYAARRATRRNEQNLQRLPA